MSPSWRQRSQPIDGPTCKLVGEYPLAAGFVRSVFRDADKLMARATGQGAFQLFAESEEKFFAKVADIRIEIKKDAAGAVRGWCCFKHVSMPIN